MTLYRKPELYFFLYRTCWKLETPAGDKFSTDQICFCLYWWLNQVNNFSVMLGWFPVFLCRTSTKQQINCLAFGRCDLLHVSLLTVWWPFHHQVELWIWVRLQLEGETLSWLEPHSGNLHPVNEQHFIIYPLWAGNPETDTVKRYFSYFSMRQFLWAPKTYAITNG